MKIIIGSDHAGFPAKEWIKEFLESKGHQIEDAGPFGDDSCDYPDFAAGVAGAVSHEKAERGILVCGTGIGMSMVANKFRGVRAALCHDGETARMSRAHNDANILCMGARILTREIMEEIIQAWIETGFDGGRHGERVKKIHQWEK